MSAISRDEWLKALGDSVAPPDPDAQTVRELAELFGVGRSNMEEHLRRLVTEGKAIKTVKLTRDVNGFTKRVTAYKLVKGKK